MATEMMHIFLEKKKLYAKLPKEKSLIRKFKRDFRVCKGERFGCLGEEKVALHHIIAPNEILCLGKENQFDLEIINIYPGNNEYILVFKL